MARSTDMDERPLWEILPRTAFFKHEDIDNNYILTMGYA